ncbi:MAG: ATP-dependent zinc metalloprotease FtsH, partial [Clostridia bacterium]|nr:ATP-dependent zinc metalloprotease FtsH [Clostridia bacterium]
KFSDVAGADEEKQELKELVDFLKDPKKFIDLGARTPKGVLLVGPPGTGKTLLAKAVAGESNAPFFSISGSDFVEMFVGVGASRVRDLFEKAKQHMPSIIFIDEIDAVGRQRGAGLGGGNDEREQTLNQLLVQLDGFEQSDGVIVIAATNRPDVLDPALLRPGRFDRQVYVNLPDIKGREEILKVHARNKKFASDVDLSVVAKITTGFSGADLANLLNEAAILTGRDNRLSITMIDINEALDKVIMGPQKRSHVYTEKDKKLTAYHESGHAILHKKLEHCDDVQEVSIIPRGMAGGYTMSRPETDDHYATQNKLNDEIAVFMGGRIAEELVFKDISTGASNDIEQATKIAKKMVTQYGMSNLGFINFGSQNEVFIGRDYQSQNSYSEKTASEIDSEIKRIIDYNYNRAKAILQENFSKLETMANLLLEKETIYTEQVDMVMNDVPLNEIFASIDKRNEEEKKRIEEEREHHKKTIELRKQELRQKTIDALKEDGIELKIVKKEDQQDATSNDSVNKENLENGNLNNSVNEENIEEKTTVDSQNDTNNTYTNDNSNLQNEKIDDDKNNNDNKQKE